MATSVPLALSVRVNGSEPELRFFHTFVMAVKGSAEQHTIDGTSNLWREVAPRLSHQFEAVRHAVVALGAMHHLNRSAETGGADRDPTVLVPQDAKLRLFAMAQYNAAVGKLQRQMGTAPPDESALAALVCCLAFVALENLRGNYRAAVSHLAGGARIAAATLDLRGLCDFDGGRAPREAGAGRTSLAGVADSELRALVASLREAEQCTALFSTNLQPVLAAELLRARAHAAGETPTSSPPPASEIRDAASARAARVDLVGDVLARDWATRRASRGGGGAFWADDDVLREQRRLGERAARLAGRIQAFTAARRGCEDGGSPALVELLAARHAQGLVALMPTRGRGRRRERDEMLRSPFFKHELVGEMVRLAEAVRATEKAAAGGNEAGASDAPSFSPHVGVVAPMYFACLHAVVPEHRTRALKILVDAADVREGPWVASYVARLLESACAASARGVPVVDLGLLGSPEEDLDCHRLFSEFKVRRCDALAKGHSKPVDRAIGKDMERRRKGWYLGPKDRRHGEEVTLIEAS